MTRTVYRVEYTPPVSPSVCWEKQPVITSQSLSDAQWKELGFDREDVCCVEWQESPVLLVELWRKEEAALKAGSKPALTQSFLDDIHRIALAEGWPCGDNT